MRTVEMVCFRRKENAVGIYLEYGVPTDSTGTAIRLGIERGFFREEGIDLSMRAIFGGPEISAAYDSGELQFGELGTPPSVTAIGNGAQYRMVGSASLRGVALFFVVHPSIGSWEDLRGRVVGALSLGSCSFWYLRELLTQHQIDPDNDLTIRPLGPDYARQLDLFRNGEISALLSSEPFISQGERDGIVNCWGSIFALADVPRQQWSVQVANRQFALEEPEMLEAALRAARRSQSYAIENLGEWADFNARILNLDEATAKAAIERDLPFLSGDGQLDIEGLENVIALQAKMGAIDRILPVSYFTEFGSGQTPEAGVLMKQF